MRDAADFVDERRLGAVVAECWNLPIRRMRYLAEGGGAYHWVAHTADDDRVFITCDDLTTKPWLGHDSDSVFAGLTSTYATAMRLWTVHALRFVCSPLPSVGGEPAVRLDTSHSVAVLPFVDGQPGSWGHPLGTAARYELLCMLAAVHAAPHDEGPIDKAALSTPGPTVDSRRMLHDAMDDSRGSWDNGPLSEQARQVVRSHAGLVHAWLEEVDGYCSDTTVDPVLTHGEPHPGNLMQTAQGLVLLDWDTLAVDRPERDLWMLDDGSGDILDGYAALTGRRADPRGLSAYRLLWTLADIAAFTTRLRQPHQPTPDAVRALDGLRAIFAGTEPAPW